VAGLLRALAAPGLREIVLHAITETAVHAGHLDAARELLDGRTWMGPEEAPIPRG
jgi:hypothetical protein